MGEDQQQGGWGLVEFEQEGARGQGANSGARACHVVTTPAKTAGRKLRICQVWDTVARIYAPVLRLPMSLLTFSPAPLTAAALQG